MTFDGCDSRESSGPLWCLQGGTLLIRGSAGWDATLAITMLPVRLPGFTVMVEPLSKAPPILLWTV